MKKLLTGVALIIAAALILQGCSSSSGKYSRVGSTGEYGTGPGHTRPFPQSAPVDLKGVKSVPVRYEKTDGRGCNRNYTVLGKNYEVWNGMDSYIEEGTASWYGPNFHGKKTSMGETYNQKGISAAHKNVPLPSYLKVTNLKNGKKMVVRVNDRGPFVGDRIIDLSEGAARYLGVFGPGTAKVRLEYLNVGRNGEIKNAVNSSSSVITGNGAYSGKSGSSVSGPSYGVNVGSNVNKALESFASSEDTFPVEGDLTAKSGWVNSDGWISYDNASVNRAQTPTSSSSTTKASATANSALNYTGNTGASYGYYVQMAATSDEAKAREICSMMAKRLKIEVKVQNQNGVSRVLAGPFNTEKQARDMAAKARAQGASDSFIKKL